MSNRIFGPLFVLLFVGVALAIAVGDVVLGRYKTHPAEFWSAVLAFGGMLAVWRCLIDLNGDIERVESHPDDEDASPPEG